MKIPAAFATPTFPPVNTPVHLIHSCLFVNKRYIVPGMSRIPMFPWSTFSGSRVSPTYRSLSFSEDKKNQIAVGGSHDPQYLTQPIKLGFRASIFSLFQEKSYV